MPAIGRALVGALFLVSGVMKIGRFAGMAAALAGKGLPLPEVLIALAIVLEVAGGLALIVGWRTREAALALALFCIPATWLFHAFWLVDAAAFGNQLNHFLKNVAIFGALLMIASGVNRTHATAPSTSH
jgi:putative oxidoreductase